MIFADTSALAALANPGDQNHARALAAWEELRARHERLLVTELIVAELAILLRSRAGHLVATRACELVMASAVVELQFVDAELFQKGFALFRRYRERVLSLTDCVSFAAMRTRRIDRAFAFDADFQAMGFELVGPEV